MPRPARTLYSLALLSLAAAPGCDDNPPVAPVSGKVLYNGEPLPFGNIMFQPEQGQTGGAVIQPDGSFRVSTFSEYDGAIVGSHKVSIACYSAQSPAAQAKRTGGEMSLGESLVPAHYSFLDQSGLTAEVPPEGTESLVFELTGPPRTFPK
jgi:hypothetical protein